MKRPAPANPAVSAQMQRMPTRNTKPEVALRRELHSRGIRFRIHGALPGRPDVVLVRPRVAVFVDGCFWHGCPQHGALPRNNREWWIKKLDATRARDGRKDADLAALGWSVVHVWEHEDPVVAATELERRWSASAPERVTRSPPEKCEILVVDAATGRREAPQR